MMGIYFACNGEYMAREHLLNGRNRGIDAIPTLHDYHRIGVTAVLYKGVLQQRTAADRIGLVPALNVALDQSLGVVHSLTPVVCDCADTECFRHGGKSITSEV